MLDDVSRASLAIAAVFLLAGSACANLIDFSVTSVYLQGRTVFYTIKNTGPSQSFYGLSTLSVNGAQVDTDICDVLAPGATGTESFKYVFSCAGTASVKVCTDPSIYDQDPTAANNCKTVTLACPASGSAVTAPDLIVAGINLDCQHSPGSAGLVWYDAGNIGTANASASHSTWYLDGARVCSDVMGPFVPSRVPYTSGNSFDFQTWAFPGTTPPYECFSHWGYACTPGHSNVIKVCVDTNNEVAESNENNNCLSISYVCGSSMCPTTSTTSTTTTTTSSTTTTIPLVNNATFVSQVVPVMCAGYPYNVSVTMKNTGTRSWTAAGNYRLGSQNPQDNVIWGTSRAFLSGSETIAPGSQKTFSFTVTAPGTPGVYNFQWRMVQEAVEWFGSFTSNVAVNVANCATTTTTTTTTTTSSTTTTVPPVNNASFISQVVPVMCAGYPYNVSVTMRNTGTTNWTAAGNYRLGSQNPQDNLVWGTGRAYLSGSDYIVPGAQKTFSFTVTAPGTPGVYNFQWRMVQEAVEWFGSFTSNVAVNVSNCATTTTTTTTSTTTTTTRPPTTSSTTTTTTSSTTSTTVPGSRHVTLVYRVADESPLSCILWLNGHNEKTSTGVGSGDNSFDVTVRPGVYNWTVECLDTGGHDVYATNTGTKGHWVFVVPGTPLPPTTTTSSTTTTTSSTTTHPPASTTTSTSSTTTHPPTTTTTSTSTTTTVCKSNTQACTSGGECCSGVCNCGFCCNSGECGWGSSPPVCVPNGGRRSNQWLDGICVNGRWDTFTCGWGCNTDSCSPGGGKFDCYTGSCTYQSSDSKYYCVTASCNPTTTTIYPLTTTTRPPTTTTTTTSTITTITSDCGRVISAGTASSSCSNDDDCWPKECNNGVCCNMNSECGYAGRCYPQGTSRSAGGTCGGWVRCWLGEWDTGGCMPCSNDDQCTAGTNQMSCVNGYCCTPTHCGYACGCYKTDGIIKQADGHYYKCFLEDWELYA